MYVSFMLFGESDMTQQFKLPNGDTVEAREYAILFDTGEYDEYDDPVYALGFTDRLTAPYEDFNLEVSLPGEAKSRVKMLREAYHKLAHELKLRLFTWDNVEQLADLL